MSSGNVIWFSARKGFGFIQPEDNSTGVYVNIKTLRIAGIEDLAEHQKVSYEIDLGVNNKPAAVNLKLI